MSGPDWKQLSSCTEVVVDGEQFINNGIPFALPEKDDVECDRISNRYLQYLQQIKTDDQAAASDLETNANSLKFWQEAPLFTSSVFTYAQSQKRLSDGHLQHGVLGLLKGSSALPVISADTQENIILCNAEEPFSTFICGSQGSGKSYTLSCLLENYLLRDPRIGVLETPLTAMVFHYDKFTGYNIGQICESAYLCSVGIPVKVLVAPTSLHKMTKQYSNLPGVHATVARPEVIPLYFRQENLSVDMMMTLMAVQDAGGSAPLYISSIRQVLREIAFAKQLDPGFDYADFRYRLANLPLTSSQLSPLNLRLEMLESFLLEKDQNCEASAIVETIWKFEPGTITIVDLSDQFVNENDACALFSICLKLFMADWRSNPRVIALDEAHKFLTGTSEATQLTNDLVALIRQQRHLSCRVVIATQEPTVSGELLDLCNLSIIHRFSSPKWYSTIKMHLAGAAGCGRNGEDLFSEILELHTGEALIFCPTAVLMDGQRCSHLLRDKYLRIKMRHRVSADGGTSVRAADKHYADTHNHVPAILDYKRLSSKSLPSPGGLVGKGQRSSLHITVPTTVKSARTYCQPTKAAVASSADSVAPKCKPIKRIAIARNIMPGYQNSDISQSDLESRMQKTLLTILRDHPNLYKEDPLSHLGNVLRSVSVQCGLPPRYLRSHDIVYNEESTRAMTILKQFLKEYCDEIKVPLNQRADLPWLRC